MRKLAAPLIFAALASAAIWIVVLNADPVVHNAQPIPPFEPAPPVTEPAAVIPTEAGPEVASPDVASPESTEPVQAVSALAFLVVGDTGTGREGQHAVAKAMASKARTSGAEFVILLGDNFYPRGVKSARDKQWARAFTQPFDYPELDIPFYAVLGNHDYRGEPDAQVGWSGDPRWNMPARHYRIARTFGDRSLDLFFLDTTPFVDSSPPEGGLTEWLRNELELSTADWKIVAGHHPIHSGGEHGGERRLQRKLEPLLLYHGVAVYLSGHDHDLQLILPKRGIPQIVSGAGARPRSVDWTDDTVFAAAGLGFTWLRLEPDALWIEFVDTAGEVLYAHRLQAR